jgi:hypothetical protein
VRPWARLDVRIRKVVRDRRARVLIAGRSVAIEVKVWTATSQGRLRPRPIFSP